MIFKPCLFSIDSLFGKIFIFGKIVYNIFAPTSRWSMLNLFLFFGNSCIVLVLYVY